jgi:hypothetical protein
VVSLGLTLALAVREPVGRWEPAGSLSVGRYAPAAVVLADGTALVAGGYSFETGQTLSSAERFDPGTGRWQPVGAMAFDRNFAQAVRLPDETVLVLGGYRERRGTTEVVEQFDPKTLRFSPANPLQDERELFTATPLPDGRILVAGGYSTRRRQTLATLELYEPAARAFRRLTATLKEARFGHEALLLPDGRVLIAGGKAIPGERRALGLEYFDPKTGMLTGADEQLAVGRDRPTLSLLPGGMTVLIAGGSAQEGGTRAARAAELLDLKTGKLQPGPSLLHDRMAHTAASLPNGQVLLAGGWSDSAGVTVAEAELYDPAAHRFLAAAPQAAGRHDHACQRLKDGRVLIAGGKQVRPGTGDSPVAAELFTLP